MAKWVDGDKSGENFRIHRSTILLLVLLLLTSCNFRNRYPAPVVRALGKAGKNRDEMLKVLDHYSDNPKDSLKLRAAYFLIGNMPGHTFNQRSGIFETVFDSATTYHHWEHRQRYFARGMKSLKQEYPVDFYADSVIEDIKHISAEYLIDNIDLAFKAYNQIPSKYQPGFESFRKTILPYRISNEPLEADSRPKLYQKYQWVHQELKTGKPLPDVVHAMIDSMQLRIGMDNGYPGLFTISEVEKVHFGRCPDLVNYAANAFRAVGIPASYDFTPHWGNNFGWGHGWLAIKAPGLFLPVDVTSNKRMNDLYRKASLPKAYRNTFALNPKDSSFTQDVTGAYKPENRIAIANRWNKDVGGKQVALTVFDRNQIWSPVGRAQSVSSDSAHFENISSQVVFMAGYNDDSRTFQPLNYPFIVDKEQQINYMNPEIGGTIDSVTLLRKYPPFFLRGGKHKITWIKDVNTLEVQASNNPSFTPYHTILNVDDFYSTHVQTLPLSYKGTYQYYRIVSPGIWLATLRLVSDHRLENSDARNIWWSFGTGKLRDSNPLSYSGGPKFEASYTYSTPVKVDAIEVQPRNDNNHINPGDTYQLMYWDKSWQPVGPSRTAQVTILVYHDLPEKALYWLRNLDRGKEESVFTLTEDGDQWWPGVSGY